MLVAAGVAPVGERLGVGHLRRLVVDLHDPQLGGIDRLCCQADSLGRDPDQEVPDGRVVTHRPDELPHHAQPAAARHRAAVRVEVPRDDPQQGGLAGAVGADQRHDRPVADPEAHLVQQRPPVGEGEGDLVEVDVSHLATLAARRVAPPPL